MQSNDRGALANDSELDPSHGRAGEVFVSKVLSSGTEEESTCPVCLHG